MQIFVKINCYTGIRIKYPFAVILSGSLSVTSQFTLSHKRARLVFSFSSIRLYTSSGETHIRCERAPTSDWPHWCTIFLNVARFESDRGNTFPFLVLERSNANGYAMYALIVLYEYSYTWTGKWMKECWIIVFLLLDFDMTTAAGTLDKATQFFHS